MKLRTLLAGTAIATLALLGAPHAINSSGLIASAEAATNVSFSLFYDQLGDYGDWVSYQNDYVFIPASVGPNWRPYTRGHWGYTERFGWTWVSDEPFGWATYHYGRWGYSDDIGWYWVPGKRWAPAWVSWRRSNDYVVWAPLPPVRRGGGGADFAVDITVGDVPDYYWVAVPSRRFLDQDVGRVVVRDDRDVIRRSKFIGSPRVTNNIVINNVIDVDVISRDVGHKVRRMEVRTTDNPGEARSHRGEVTAFQGVISGDGDAKPSRVSDVGKVKKIKRGKGEQGNDPADANAAMPGMNTGAAPGNDAAQTGTQPGSTEANAPGKVRNKKSNGGDQNAGTNTEQPATGQAEAPADRGKQAEAPADGKKKKRNKSNDAATATQPDSSVNTDNAQANAPVKKRKNKSGDNGSDQATGAGSDKGQGNAQAQGNGQDQGGKRRKKQPGSDMEQSTGSTTAAPTRAGKSQAEGAAQDQGQQPAGKRRDKKNGQPCDPSTGADCSVQQ